MKLPQIQTRHKIRDAKICRLWAEDLMPLIGIGKQFGISATRIRAILYRNKEFLNSEVKWEKTQRIVWLKRQIKRANVAKKDPADLMQQLRIEIEGDKPLIDNSQHAHFTIEIKTDDANNRSPVALQTENSLGRNTDK